MAFDAGSVEKESEKLEKAKEETKEAKDLDEEE